MPYVATNPTSYAGTLPVGSGECVALVQHATGAPHTPSWTKGALVKGNTSIAAGTAIATFDAEGRYASHRHGNHAAIYLSQDASGILVIDQWNKRDAKGHIVRHIGPHRHLLVLDDTKATSDNGNNFSVIQ